LKRLFQLAWNYWPDCLALVALQVSLLLLGLGALGATGLAIDYLRSQIQPGSPKPYWDFGPRTLLILGGAIIGLAAIRAVLTMLNTIAVNRLGQARIVVELRARVYQRMQRMSFRFFDGNATGSLINRVTGDVQSVRLFIDGVVLQSLGVIAGSAVYLTTMMRIHAGLAIACLGFLPMVLILVVSFAKLLRRDYEKGRITVDQLVRTFEELARGMGVIKSFGIESWAEKRFMTDNAHVRYQKSRVFGKLMLLSPLVSLLNQLSMAILLGYGGWLAIKGEIAVGAGLLVFAGVLQQLAAQVNAVGSIADNLQQTLTGADRIYEVLDAPDGLANRADAIPLSRAEGAIEFQDVNFHFQPENRVLHGINLKISPGEKIAIVGPTGSGKSALVSLVARFYDPDGGIVRLDGHDLRDLRLDDVRRQAGVVFQESFLFRASVAANISFGNPGASPEAIERAARLASAHEFIERLPRGYETLLHENGSNLSGGQRQRLALARAILLDPAILILDDPTAAVDAGTEHEILSAMEGVMKGRTTLIIAHRFSTVRRADRIVIMDEGRIAAIGTHEELAQRPGYYRDAILAEKGVVKI